MTPSEISVVIPALNEESSIAVAVRSAVQAGAGEIIVVDGGSQDDTIGAARQAGATKIVRSLPGRGVQLNSGVVLVDFHQRVVLFLHADNALDPNCLEQICDREESIWGAFRQRIESPATIYRWIEWGNAMRVRLRRMPFGDQAVFVRKEVLDRQGGFEEIPLMEDVALSRRLRRIAKPVLLPGPVQVNARRWQGRGPIRQTLRNWWIQLAYAAGVSPQRLKEWYR
jgi:rSAM/selenodomain-associated transferase 2